MSWQLWAVRAMGRRSNVERMLQVGGPVWPNGNRLKIHEYKFGNIGNKSSIRLAFATASFHRVVDEVQTQCFCEFCGAAAYDLQPVFMTCCMRDILTL